MDPYSPAKYALRAPPPIPPRPGTVDEPIRRNDGPGPPLPPRRPSVTQSFPPPPRRHVPQGATQPPTYRQAYDPGQYGPPPAQITSHYAPSPTPPQHPTPLPQRNIPPAPSAYQPPPYHASAPSKAHVSFSPQISNYGASAATPQYASREEYTQPSYHPPAAPAYPPPPTNAVVQSYGAHPFQEDSAQQPVINAQAHTSQPPPHYSPPPVSTPATPAAMATYPPPPASPQINTYVVPDIRGNPKHQATAQSHCQHAQPPSYHPPPPTSAPSIPTYPPPPSHQDADYGPPPMTVDSGGYEPSRTKPSLPQLSGLYFPPDASPMSAYHTPYTSSPRAPDEPHRNAERSATSAATESLTPQAPSPYKSESGAFVNYPPPSYEQPQGPPPPAAPPTLSGIDKLAESLLHTHIDTRAEAPSDQRSQLGSKAPPRPPIQYNALAKFTLRQCPSTEYNFTGESQWYIHPQVLDFRICVYCYEKNIESTRFEAEFHAWKSPAGSSPQCLFSCPRIEDDIWPRAVHSGDLQELLDVFARRLSIPNCPRHRGVPATEKRKWYQPRDKQKFPDFLACEACNEDVLLSGALRDEFILFTGTQAKETLFICDAANLYVRKLATKTNSMDTFISETIRHLCLPECEKNGALTDGPSRKWYQPRNPVSSTIAICERCFEEYAAHTDFETYFQPMAQPNAQHRCMLGLWQSRSVWDEALANHSFTLWECTMLEITNTPLCTLEIARGIAVYQIPGVDNFDVCHACYVGLLKPFGMDRFFQRVQDPVYGQCACDLNAGAPRIAAFAKKLDEAMITATFETFATFAARFSTTDMCPKLNLTSGRTWYGNDSCRICPACYEEVVTDSSLAKQGYFPPTPMTIQEEICCDLYSPRMRSKFKSACSTQDGNSFLTFATHRKNIYTQTVPEMRALVARSKHNLSMQKMYNTTSSAYNNMDGISMVGLYDNGFRYTGSGVPGMFKTHWGVEGAAMGQTAMGYMQQIQVDAARVRYLQGVWDGVE